MVVMSAHRVLSLLPPRCSPPRAVRPTPFDVRTTRANAMAQSENREWGAVGVGCGGAMVMRRVGCLRVSEAPCHDSRRGAHFGGLRAGGGVLSDLSGCHSIKLGVLPRHQVPRHQVGELALNEVIHW